MDSPLNKMLLAAYISDRYSRKELNEVATGVEQDLYLFDYRRKGARIGIFTCPAGIPFHVHIGIKVPFCETIACRLNLSRFPEAAGLPRQLYIDKWNQEMQSADTWMKHMLN